MKSLLTVVLAMTTTLTTSCVTATDEDQHALTIYSRMGAGAVSPDLYRSSATSGRNQINVPGYAVVRTVRNMPLQSGVSEVKFSDVAAGIDPTTVSFSSLTDTAGTRVLEQNYQFDLVSAQKLLERYIGQKIIVEQVRGEQVDRVEGELLGTVGGLTMGLDDGRVIAVQNYANVYYPELPGGLITQPTLVWMIDAERGGDHDIAVGYQTEGMTWWADYNAVLHDGDECTLDLNAWVSIVNQSGASFPEARLKLVAGDVNRAPTAQPRRQVYQKEMVAMAVADEGFAESELFEYHLYTLGRRTSVPDRSTKQLELFPAANGLKCERTLLYEGSRHAGYGNRPQVNQGYLANTNSPVQAFVSFENKESDGLGIPLPKGRVRVSQLNPSDGALEFIGEDLIDHTPRNETVSLKLGDAFDVVGERTQVNFKVDERTRVMEETYRIEIRNQKRGSATVTIKEAMYRWNNWQISKSNHDYETLDAATIQFILNIPAEETGVVEYTVRYTW